jgi:hypothetical protein
VRAGRPRYRGHDLQPKQSRRENERLDRDPIGLSWIGDPISRFSARLFRKAGFHVALNAALRFRIMPQAREVMADHKHDNPKSAACGSPRCQAYRPYRRRGRVAEGGGLLNRYRVVKPYRGFESLRLRQNCNRLFSQ